MADSDEATLLRFYDELAADYDLVYGGRWEAAVERQAAALDGLIRELAPGARAVLDCSCGIGTQALGLARLGYRVVGSDISTSAIDRARREAERLGVEADFRVADFRDLSGIDGPFDVVLSCDNAVPHLLDEDDVPKALAAMHARLRPGGLLVLTMRDFDRALAERQPVAPPVVVPGRLRRVLVRLHDWDEAEPCYTVRYLVLTEADEGWTVKEHATRYRAITRAELTAAAEAAGFGEIAWPAGRTVVGGQQVMTARASQEPRAADAHRMPSP
jgi:glycine/sarcosine N-methyltransferase